MAGRKRRRSSFPGLLLPLVFGLLLWLGGKAPWIAAEAPNAEPRPAPAPTPVPAPTKNTERAHRIPTVAVDPQSVWASPEACAEAIAPLLAAPRANTLRIASWNLHWFPDGRKEGPGSDGGADVEWMACAMASLRADVIAIQEITTGPRGRTALLKLIAELEKHTRGDWRDHLDDCPGTTRQHLGFLYNTARVSFTQLRSIAAINAYGGCAKGLRPGIAGRLRFGADELDLVTVHLDSGATERDYNNRLKAVRSLVEGFSARATKPMLSIGDFNTMGCSECALPADVEEEVTQLHHVLEPAGYRFVDGPSTEAACSDHFQGVPQLLDRAITTLPTERVRFEMAGLCAELACQRPRTTSAALSRLSDHCPVVVEVMPEAN